MTAAPSMAEVLASAINAVESRYSDPSVEQYAHTAAQALAAAGFGHVASSEAERDEHAAPDADDFPDCEGWMCQSCGKDNYIPAGYSRTPAEPDADEREALIDVLVMTPMADHIGTDLAPVERTADAVLAAGYSRTPDAHLAAAKAEAWDEGRKHGMDEDLCRFDFNPYRAARLREQGEG